MSGYRIECERVLGPSAGDYWSATFGLYDDDQRIQQVVVTLPFRALGEFRTCLQDRGVERRDEEIATAVLRTEGKRRIRERLKVPGGRCPPEISIDADDFLEPGRKEDILREAGLL